MTATPRPRLGPLALALAALAIALAAGARAPVIATAPASGTPSLPPIVIRQVPIPASSLVSGSSSGSLRLTGSDGVTARSAVSTRWTNVCAPIQFSAFGVAWDQQGAGTVGAEARTAATRAELARSHVVGLTQDMGPDPGSADYQVARRATAMDWVGSARCASVRLRLPAGTTLTGAHAVFINALGNPNGGPPVQVQLSPSTSPEAPSPTGAAPAKPSIITRSQWGADSSLLNCFAGYSPTVKIAFIHHTDGSNSYTKGESYGLVRSIYAYHTNGNGWCDIGYNFLVDRYGEIFEGRAGGVESAVLPAAQMGFNTNSVAVAAMGNFQTGTPTSALLTGIKNLLAWKLNLTHVPPGGKVSLQSKGGSGVKYPKGSWADLHTISGHRDVDYTDCPGDNLYADLGSIRSAVKSIGDPKIYVPAQSTSSFTPGTGSVTWTSEASTKLSWTIVVRTATGTVLRTFTASAQNPSVTWNGETTGGAPEPPGTYVVTMSGKTSGGTLAGSAVFDLTLKGASTAGTLLFDSNAAGTPTTLFTAGGDGSGAAPLPGAVQGYDAAWSPDGSRIAFISDRTGSPELFVMNGDGTSRKQLTFKGTSNIQPSWSPDGRQIAFTSNRTGSNQVWMINADGQGVTRLTTGGGSQPAWSPDGSEIAFTSTRSGTTQVWVVDVNGHSLRQFTRTGSMNDQPTWSPDGKLLAFVSSRTGVDQVWTVTSADKNPTQVTTNTDPTTDPAYSPDGAHLAFVITSGGSAQIYIANADGSGPIPVTSSGSLNELPSWTFVDP